MPKVLVTVVLVLVTACSSFGQKVLRLINRGKYDKAEERIAATLDYFRAYDQATPPEAYPMGKMSRKVWAYHARANVARIKGDFARAEANYIIADSAYRALMEARKQKHHANFADQMLNWTIAGDILKQRHDRRHYERRNAVAGMYIRLGEFDRARYILDSTFRAMRFTYGEKTSMAVSSYATYGEYFLEQGKPDSSLYYNERYALALRSDPNYYDLSLKKISDAYSGLAEAYLQINEPEKAIFTARKAHKHAHHRFVKATDGKNLFGKIRATNQLAEAYRLMADYEHALQWNNKAMRYFQNNIGIVTPEKLPVLATRGQIFWAKNDTASANACFRDMMNIFFEYTQNNFSYLSEQERAYFYRNNKHLLELARGYYHYLYFKKGIREPYVLRRLYEINLNNKGVLLSSASKLLNQVYASGDSSLVQSYLEIRKLKNDHTRLVATGKRSELAVLERQIVEKERHLRSRLSIRTDPYVTISDVIRELPDSMQLVDIMRTTIYNIIQENGKTWLRATGEPSYLYFVLQRDAEPLLVENPVPGTELETKYYQGYLNFARLDMRDRRVYEALFEPIAKHLAKKNIIIAADGIYNLINPDILFDGDDYLIQRFRFHSVVSARDVLAPHTDHTDLKEITLIGWPDYSAHSRVHNRDFNDLPGTAMEIRAISKAVEQTSRYETYIREQANEWVVKNLPSTSVLHFATHGFFEATEAKDPMYTSGLVLAITDSIDNREDGYLTAYEASNLNLRNTFLVVLSACETGQGEFEEGEGVWGLQRAFQVAGVRYTVMSLFKVDDEITALLMTKFYRNLLEGVNVLTAFRKAQLEVKEQFPGPVEWGAFVIKGL